MAIGLQPEALPSRDVRSPDSWIFKDREGVEQRFGMEMERIHSLTQTDEGKRQLILTMKALDPALNGDAQGVLEQVTSNIDQLKKKESFLSKMLNLPRRAMESVGRTIKKHPVLTTAAGIAALIALLYFTSPLAPTAGEYGLQLIDGFKVALGKLGVPLPEVGVDAVANVPVTGAADTLLGEQVVEAMASPSTVSGMTTEFLGAAGQGSEAAGNAAEIAAEAIRGLNATPLESFVDPLQQVLEGMPAPQ